MESRLPHQIPGVASPTPLLLPIGQMRSSRVENDYTDSPAVVRQQPVQEGRLKSPSQRETSSDITHPWITFGGRPGSSASSSSSSSSTSSSDQRLLERATPSLLALPKAMPLRGEPAGKHAVLACEACGKCRCTDCTLPRTLPSCWVCGQDFLCSAPNLVDAATCMCLVKGVLYHCADDQEEEEGSCAERPCSCSCSRPDCCPRWALMAGLSLLLPCLLCYLPATGCTALAQRCYDSACRPGCRCKGPALKTPI